MIRGDDHDGGDGRRVERRERSGDDAAALVARMPAAVTTAIVTWMLGIAASGW